jgi:serine/threonine protein kinase
MPVEPNPENGYNSLDDSPAMEEVKTMQRMKALFPPDSFENRHIMSLGTDPIKMTLSGVDWVVMGLMPLCQFTLDDTKFDCLPQTKMLEIFCCVTHAVKVLHSKGVVHLDIKPANIGVRELNGKLYGVLLDFDHALWIREDYGSDTIATAECGRRGTPGYLSPERSQLYGYVGPAADIYALGCVLHTIVTGTILCDYTGAGSVDQFAEVDSQNRIFDETQLSSSLADHAIVTSKKALNTLQTKHREMIECIDDTLDGQLYALMHGMLHLDPNQRLTIEQVYNDRALQSYRHRSEADMS